ncbi:MAG: putative primase [Enterobacter phage ENC16]|nr:MAG: putative primase [Enterobacter phage ENC16]
MTEAPWLQACKRLAVGQTARFRCCGRTPAAVLFNKPEAWQMYCHRCKESLSERKQYVSLVQPEVLPRVLPAPAQLIQISQTSAELQAQLYGFLMSKGIWPEMAGAVYYSAQLKRLVWDLQNGTYLARALHQYQQPKWVMLGEPASYAAASTVVNPDAVVLTEDYLSSLKIQHCMEIYGGSTSICSIALLGTRLSLPLKVKLIQLGKPVLLMLDNDEAGWAGAKTIQRTLKPFLPVHDRVLRDDPKACHISEILEGLK